MSEGVWTIGRVDIGNVDSQTSSSPDNFKRQSALGVGTAGIVIGTAGKPGRLYRLKVVNGAATAYFLQVFNKATAPVNTDVPTWVQRLAVSSETDIDLTNINGLLCPLGMGIAISSTAGTLTLAIANDIAFYSAHYTQRA